MTENSTYKKTTRKRVRALIVCLGLLISAVIGDLITGTSNLTVAGTLRILWEGAGGETKYHLIVWAIRMPMTLTCLWVGASLALAGEQMQTILQNPLASPYTLGISSAAGFGASFGIISGFPFLPIPWLNTSVSALIFSLGASAVIMLVCQRKETDTKGMILIGVMIAFFFTALQSFMQYLADDRQVAEIMHWMFGSLAKASWLGSMICGISFVIFFLVSMKLSWSLTALSAGEERAASMGIRTGKLRNRVFFYSSCLTAVAVSYVGAIGFIGLVAPHLARNYAGDDQRFLAPLSAVFGSIILLLASVLAKILKPGELLPVGIITNLVGVVFLLGLIVRRKV